MKFSKTHEWIKEEGEVILVGITDYAQNEMGDIVYADLPEVGKVIAAGDEVCELESVKAVVPVNSPVGGEVVEVNGALDDDPSLINREAETAWLFKVKSDGSQIDMMCESEYKKYLKTL